MMDIFEELEALDQPRGAVKAANLHAGKKINMVVIIKAAKALDDKDEAKKLLEMAKAIYKGHFDDFIAGANWAAEKFGKKKA